MPITKINKTKKYTLVLWKIKESILDLLKQLNPTEKELIEINRFKNTNRKKQNIISRLILNHLANKKVKLQYSKQGVPSCNSFEHISISHSKDYCAIIISGKKIGIDIQCLKKNILDLSPKFINEKEKKICKDNSMKLHFIWCAKEAVYKTLNGKSCSFKESIYIENVINGNITNGHYNHKKMSVKYDIYCEIFEEYFMSIAMIKS